MGTRTGRPTRDQSPPTPPEGGKPWRGVLVAAGLAILATGALLLVDRAPAAATLPENLVVRVVETHPHDPTAYTQGLLWHEGAVYESTGLRGRSSLRRVELRTGKVTQRVDLDPAVFGEGLALVGDRFVQLTWQSGRALVWDRDTLERRDEHSYSGQGWGLCYDGRQLVMSDGSAHLTFRDAETFEARRRVQVTRLGRPVRMLNELECVEDQVWANVYRTEKIVRIDPRTGEVTATVDASGLLDSSERQGSDVLNGIAWIADRRRFLLTGKLWPKTFEVEFVADQRKRD